MRSSKGAPPAFLVIHHDVVPRKHQRLPISRRQVAGEHEPGKREEKDFSQQRQPGPWIGQCDEVFHVASDGQGQGPDAVGDAAPENNRERNDQEDKEKHAMVGYAHFGSR